MFDIIQLVVTHMVTVLNPVDSFRANVQAQTPLQWTRRQTARMEAARESFPLFALCEASAAGLQHHHSVVS
jgi:hypothetical protein